ncbi:MAG: hypothetical protein V2J13_09660 [Cycloclasticus sp.]|jgi:hypothetical protein|nr:hypothetical protein [Cycloclasticus sp.]
MKALRVILLLSVFVFVAFYSKLQRLESTAWAESLQVSIYPINGDGSVLTEQYINSLTEVNYRSVGTFFKTQWAVYSEYDFDPVAISVKPLVISQPPLPPTNGNVLKVIFWSLRLRLWSYQNAVDSDKSTVNIFVRYHQVDDSSQLAHSLGLQKGLIGVVNAYASGNYQEQNNVVIAHEMLHTVGASDKYDLTTGQPIYPSGFADPDSRYDQSKAEIMAGKIPISVNESVMPDSLRQCVIGSKTAHEIGWLSDINDINQ